MIREAVPGDAPAIAAVAVASELFPPEEVGVVEALLADHFSGRAEGHGCLVDEDDGGALVGTAYYQPAPATDRTWYLTMIGVRRDRHRQGRGAALLSEVEARLRADGQRLLLVETSALPEFDRARAFYRSCGYDEEARVRGYFAEEDDMVLFRKDVRISTAGPPS